MIEKAGMQRKTVLIVGGGTGGHIFPGIAIAKVLHSRGWSINWVGNPKKIEGKLVKDCGIKFFPLIFEGIKNRNFLALLTFPFFLLRAFLRSWTIFSKINPSIVIGMGGHIAFPIGLVAAARGVTLILQEQNAILGRTNRHLAMFAKFVFTAFPNIYPGANDVGNPLNFDICSCAEVNDRYNARLNHPLNLLIIGGSQGASILNTIVPKSLALLEKGQRPNVLHQSGVGHLNRLRSNYEELEVQANCVEFIHNMQDAMKTADLIICRSGGMTVSEVAAIGVAALFIPFPRSKDDHQMANAKFFSENKAAWLQTQNKLNPEWLAIWLKKRSRLELKHMALKAKDKSRENAAVHIADICDLLIENRL